MKPNKIFFILLAMLFVSIPCHATISNFQILQEVRLGENLTIIGEYNAADALCKFLIKDSNNTAVIRLDDEYTFSDNTFYSEYQITEPPFYRGDDYNVVVTCGTTIVSKIFSVEQPLSIAHPLQQGWSYWFDESNLEAIMLFSALILVFLFVIVIAAFFFKRMRGN